MKTFFFLCTTLVGAYVFDIFVGQIIISFMPSVTVMVICYWLWRLDWEKRLMLAFGTGFLLDVTGFFPIGAHICVLAGLAFACGSMKLFFSNTESRFVTLLNVSLLGIAFHLLIIPVSSFIDMV